MASRPFDANWPGRCADCDERFEAGDEIRYNNEGQIVGEDCCGYDYASDTDWED